MQTLKDKYVQDTRTDALTHRRQHKCAPTYTIHITRGLNKKKKTYSQQNPFKVQFDFIRHNIFVEICFIASACNKHSTQYSNNFTHTHTRIPQAYNTSCTTVRDITSRFVYVKMYAAFRRREGFKLMHKSFKVFKFSGIMIKKYFNL